MATSELLQRFVEAGIARSWFVEDPRELSNTLGFDKFLEGSYEAEPLPDDAPANQDKPGQQNEESTSARPSIDATQYILNQLAALNLIDDMRSKEPAATPPSESRAESIEVVDSDALDSPCDVSIIEDSTKAPPSPHPVAAAPRKVRRIILDSSDCEDDEEDHDEGSPEGNDDDFLLSTPYNERCASDTHQPSASRFAIAGYEEPLSPASPDRKKKQMKKKKQPSEEDDKENAVPPSNQQTSPSPSKRKDKKRKTKIKVKPSIKGGITRRRRSSSPRMSSSPVTKIIKTRIDPPTTTKAASSTIITDKTNKKEKGIKPKRQQQPFNNDNNNNNNKDTEKKKKKNKKPTAQSSPSSSSLSPSSCAPYNSPRKFKRSREILTRRLFDEFNRSIFGGRLPSDLEITWSIRLTTTAGRAINKKVGGVYLSSVELSSKVVTTYKRLRNTLCHELCHVAAWLIHHTARPPHGTAFQHWARHSESVYPDLNITTCHNYEIECKYRYQCVNAKCGKTVGRHSKSLNLDAVCCNRCGSKLRLLPRLKKDGTPVAERAPSAFCVFVKENFAKVKAAEPPGTPHKEVMRILSTRYQQKRNQTPTTLLLGD